MKFFNIFLNTHLGSYDFYPPLHELLTGAFFLITQPSVKFAAFTNVIYLLLIIFLLWRLEIFRFGNPASILVAFVFSASTSIIIQSKYFMLDIPLTFWVLAGFYCYCVSLNFTLRSWSLLYGIIFGAALLNKWSAAFFLFFPPLATALYATLKRDELFQVILRNVFLIYVITVILSAPWYSVHFIRLLRSSTDLLYARGVLIGNPPLFSLEAWTYYLFSVIRQMSWPLGILLLSGIMVTIWRRRNLWIWSIWIGIPYLILTFIRNKDDRYTIPLLPLIGLMAFNCLDILSTSLQRKFYWFTIFLSLLQIGYVHAGSNIKILYPIFSKKILGNPLVQSQKPQADRWPIAEILKNVCDYSKDFSFRPILRVVPDAAHFNRTTFVVEQFINNYNVYLSGNTNFPSFTDFVITKTGSLGLPFCIELPTAITKKIITELPTPDRKFDLIKKYALPDGSEAMLFKRRQTSYPGTEVKIVSELKSNLKVLLSQYIQSSKLLKLDVIPESANRVFQGHFKSIVIEVQDGLIGDFKHKSLGIPISFLRAAISNITIDLPAAHQAKFVPYSLEQLKILRLEINDQELNSFLKKSAGEIKKINIYASSAESVGHFWLGKFA